MNIYELEKAATPGPLLAIHGKGTCLHEGNLDSLQWKAGMDGDEEVWETVAELWPTTRRSQAKADAKLLAHCRNNFLKALGALKLGLEILEAVQWVLGAFHIRAKVDAYVITLRALIKELEEIKQ